MNMPRVDADYPRQLRLKASQPGTPDNVREALYECARVIELMTGALEAGQLVAHDGEAVLLIRLQSDGGPSTVSVMTGKDINPADPAIILAAQEALAMIEGVGVTKQ